LNTEHKIFYI